MINLEQKKFGYIVNLTDKKDSSSNPYLKSFTNINPILHKKNLRLLFTYYGNYNNDLIKENINQICKEQNIIYDKVSITKQSHIRFKASGRLIRNGIFNIYKLKRDIFNSYDTKCQEILINYTTTFKTFKRPRTDKLFENPINFLYENDLIDFVFAYKHRAQILVHYINSYLGEQSKGAYLNRVSDIEFLNMEFLKNTKYILTPIVIDVLQNIPNINYKLPKSQVICASLLRTDPNLSESVARMDPQKFLKIKKNAKKNHKYDFRKVSDLKLFCSNHSNHFC